MDSFNTPPRPTSGMSFGSSMSELSTFSAFDLLPEINSKAPSTALPQIQTGKPPTPPTVHAQQKPQPPKNVRGRARTPPRASTPSKGNEAARANQPTNPTKPKTSPAHPRHKKRPASPPEAPAYADLKAHSRACTTPRPSTPADLRPLVRVPSSKRRSTTHHASAADPFDLARTDTDRLPLPTTEPEQYATPNELLSQFTKVIRAEEFSAKGDGVLDAVRLDGTVYSMQDWRLTKFNMMGRRLERDNAQKVGSNAELIKKFNTHEFKGSMIKSAVGGLATAITFGGYYAAKRKTVRAGNFGHYISNKRHMLKPAGIHSLVSVADTWLDDLPINDESPAGKCRKVGDKIILQVPENHIAGAYRVGCYGAESIDQEFVLLSQGRHVLPEFKYNGVCIVKLDKQQDKLGPLHILYVREGFLGGVYERKTGLYKILYPGPPYLLHEQEYDNVAIVERNNGTFHLGPYQFVTVKDGEVAGAYRKVDGTFQILPPGHSYQLHAKDFSPVQMVKRSLDKFKLGPYYYLTVRNGVEAGVYRKKDGTFQRLPAGKTYQLNEVAYKEPLHVVRDSHICKIGPLTLLTVQDGCLNGAYRHADGAFVEFNDPNQQYILHEQEYFNLSTVSKYSSQLQMFGPFKVITIRDGEVGIFEKEGAIEIKEPGFYQVTAKYTINESIPMRIFQENLSNVQFRTKDGVQMDVKFTIAWSVEDPLAVAKFSGDFAELRTLMTSRAQDALVRLCKMCSRGDLLPTKQDVVAHADDMQSDEQRETAAADSHRELVGTLVNLCRDELQSISQTSQLGLSIGKVMIEQFRLRDESILQDLEDMTKAELAKKAEKVRGELAIAKAGFEMAVREKHATAEAQFAVARQQAEAKRLLAHQNFELRAQEERAAAEAKLAQAAEKAKGELDIARAENELLRVTTEAKARIEDADADNVILKKQETTAAQIASDRQIMQAEAEAKAIVVIAEAEHKRSMNECSAESRMAPQTLELKRLQIQKEMQVEMMVGIGQAAWKYPDVYTGFLEQIKDVIQVAPQRGQHMMTSLLPQMLNATTDTPMNMNDAGKRLFKNLVTRHFMPHANRMHMPAATIAPCM